ncbi:MAG: S-methyl-5-thioribose-1-phosphate isomerase [Nitrospirae bacterium CG18_big_fil_WC_8_21_14_2_50_70_55]|nr:S-methyl-5-thioribose-1-phosphate isomerase [Deltaproteobacteria bacterium]PIQ06712.1 MAG: S-methyl-5-thioribose-1-phosphate isomerase [Nitrospirae bacterium CG18_big_fil_WC_8_21_14_2_50_70_55]PIW83193.1 MAG: S-methyl-5-thioribose-1-phosphate isomerase [Nitrospirae bacterium CG_4_8_14_3_um_filter_70_85]
MKVNGTPYRTVWMEGATVRMIDQRWLPHRFCVADLATVAATCTAIREMWVRGAGAIGATAGYAMAQAALLAEGHGWRAQIAAAAEQVRATRPTAQNLFFAVARVAAAISTAADLAAARAQAVAAAQAIADADARACEAIGAAGMELIRDGARVLTHCNAGWLAFVDWGSALSPIYKAARAGRRVRVLADETRPRGQGAMLTAWELAGEGIDHAIIADNAAALLMARGQIDLVIVGADRIAANGDVANKIGTLEKAICARHFHLPFYVAAPTATIDWDCPTGAAIPIEERDPGEVLTTWGRDADGVIVRVRTANPTSPALNPAFDVTPAELIAGILTEHGIVAPAELAPIRPPRPTSAHG